MTGASKESHFAVCFSVCVYVEHTCVCVSACMFVRRKCPFKTVNGDKVNSAESPPLFMAICPYRSALFSVSSSTCSSVSTWPVGHDSATLP